MSCSFQGAATLLSLKIPIKEGSGFKEGILTLSVLGGGLGGPMLGRSAAISKRAEGMSSPLVTFQVEASTRP